MPETFTDGWAALLCETALGSGLPIDISSQPALWGGQLRGSTAILAARSSGDLLGATDEAHAIDLTQAHLIEILCAIGREYLDYYLLRVRSSFREFQLSGFLEAVFQAIDEGHIRSLGISCEGAPRSLLALWPFHNVFDILCVDDRDSFDLLSGPAAERGVPLLSPFGRPKLAIVRSASEIRALTQELAV